MSTDVQPPVDLRTLSFFDKRSQVLNASRMSRLLSTQSPPPVGDTSVRKQGGRVVKAHFREWEIGKTLGSGAFASVYEASTEIPGCGREVRAVLKSAQIVPPTAAAEELSEENRHQFLYVTRELTTLVHLSRAHPSFPGTDHACHRKYGHPSIVKIYDGVFDNESRMFHTFMERAQGIELFDYLRMKGGKMPENEVKIVMKQLLRSLDYMHANLVLHRDIKLDNIIIDPKTLRIILIDFNLSTFYRPDVPLHEPVGCINYSSPQILTAAIHPERGGYYAERGWSDLWASGVVMYGMLVGFFPFRSQTPRKLYSEIVKLSRGKALEWVDAGHVSQAARKFVAKMLDPSLCGVLTAGELAEDPYLADAPTPVEDGWQVAGVELGQGTWAPPARVPEKLRKYWVYSSQGVAPEMCSEDLDVQFFAVRRAMFSMLGVQPPQCVIEQERRIAGEISDDEMDLDSSSASMGRPSVDEEKTTANLSVPRMDGKEPSAGTIVSQARQPSGGSDVTMGGGETGGESRPGSMDHHEGEHSVRAKDISARLSRKSKRNIARMVKTGFARVKEAVHDWKKHGGKGLVGVSGEVTDN